MKQAIIYTIVVILSILLILLLFSRIPIVSVRELQINHPEWLLQLVLPTKEGKAMAQIIEPVETKNKLLETWRYNMVICESGDSQNAINIVDLDGTSSYGLWQMKIGTFKGWVKYYNPFPWKHFEEADWKNALMSRWHQDKVMDKIIEDADNIDWNQQFPDCVAKWGLPPA